MCTTGTVRHKAEVQSKRQREKLFSDMPKAPFAVANKMAEEPQTSTTPQVLCTTKMADAKQQKKPPGIFTRLHIVVQQNPPAPPPARDLPPHVQRAKELDSEACGSARGGGGLRRLRSRTPSRHSAGHGRRLAYCQQHRRQSTSTANRRQ